MENQKFKEDADMTPASFKVQIDEKTLHVSQPEPTGRFLLEQVGKDPQTHFLVEIISGQDDVILEADDTADLQQKGIERFAVVLRARPYAFSIDEGHFTLPNPHPSGRELLELAKKSPDDYDLVQVIPFGDDQYISLDEKANLRPAGAENFITVEKDEKKGVSIWVNKKPVQIKGSKANGAQIKTAAVEQGVAIQLDFVLFDISKGGMEQVGDQTTICLIEGQKFVASSPDDNS